MVNTVQNTTNENNELEQIIKELVQEFEKINSKNISKYGNNLKLIDLILANNKKILEILAFWIREIKKIGNSRGNNYIPKIIELGKNSIQKRDSIIDEEENRDISRFKNVEIQEELLGIGINKIVNEFKFNTSLEEANSKFQQHLEQLILKADLKK